jgi:uncharacterized protein (DUF342 family)
MKLLMTYFDKNQTKMLQQKVAPDGKKSITVSSTENFVSRDEIICRIIEVDTEEDAKKYLDEGHSSYHVYPYNKFRIESSVYYDESHRCYKSHWYGFVVLDEAGNLRVITPLQVAKDKTQAYYYIHPTKFHKLPTLTDLDEELAANKIIAPLDSKDIKKQLELINPEANKLSRIKVAQSKVPVNGQGEYYEALIELERKVGKEKLDGQIDYREVGSIHEVKNGDAILKRIPEVPKVDGYTIYGDKVKAILLPHKGYSVGKNLVPSSGDQDIYVASVDGCVQKKGRKVSIVEIVYVNGDVDYESGNIDFSGTVIVSGNVLPGFEVKAGGDVTIMGNVDDALVVAKGNITVKQGIAGKGQTKVFCEGELFAKYIVNSKIETKGAITVDESIINSNIFSNDKILITSKHSKIMGGKVIARHTIEVNSIGSNKETQTDIMVGRNLEVEKVLDGIRKEITEAHHLEEEVVNKMKNRFGNQLFEDPKGFIAILPDIKKKQCVTMLGELSQHKKVIAELKEKAHEVEKKLVLNEEPLVIVKNTVFSGTTITIRREVKKILEEMENAKFYYDSTDKTIRFTSAV